MERREREKEGGTRKEETKRKRIIKIRNEKKRKTESPGRKVWIFLKILRLTAKHIENLRITKLSIYYLSVYVALFRMTDNSEETE